MFWRNDYLYDETLNEYLNSDDRTNYTYSNSRSYNSKATNDNVQQPKLFRYGVHVNSNESNETNMRTKSNSTVSTPRQRKSIEPNSRRVLRSKSNTLVIDKENNVPFVRELDADDEDIQLSYRIGALNSNTNNSGPEKVERTWTAASSSRDYHLSADEDQDLDDTTNFGTNNANINKTHRKESNQWFQKNMFGLPNDESDDVNSDFTGAISGDENYDIASLNKSNRHQSTRSVHSKRSTKSDISNRYSYLCSPIAVLSYLFECVWLCFVFTTRVTSRCYQQLESYSKSPRWYLLPLYLPGAIINRVIRLLAYSLDRLFGTTLVRRWLTPTSDTNRSIFAHLLLNALWLLFWIVIASICIYMLVGKHNESSPSIPLASVGNEVSQYLCTAVGQECMEADDCCHSNFALGRRFSFCLFSLPARWIISKIGNPKTDSETVPLVIQSNISDNSGILYQLLERIHLQEDLATKYNLRMSNLEKDFISKESSNTLRNEKVSILADELNAMAIKVTQLQKDLQQYYTAKVQIEDSINGVSNQRKEDVSSMRIDVEKLRTKLEDDMKKVHVIIAKSDNSVASSSETTKKLSVLLSELQDNISQLKTKFSTINDKTILLEAGSEKSTTDSINMKKEILEEMTKKFDIYKQEQSLVLVKLNEHISKLEETLNNDYSKLLDRDYVRKLIESHLGAVESNIKSEVNSTMWNSMKDKISAMIQSMSMKSESHAPTQTVSPVYPTSTCRCPYSSCCRQNSCVRISKVREMIASALNVYSADKIGLADFALESAGGTIATTRCTETYTDRAATLTIFGVPLLRLTNSPRTIIQPNVNPGECWAMKGSKGAVVVQLSARVLVTAVSIDHIPKSLSPSGSIDSAIKEFEIKALVDANDSVGHSLGNFTYQIDSSAVQTFMVESNEVTGSVIRNDATYCGVRELKKCGYEFLNPRINK